MLDIYVYYPRRLELTPPRQVGQVLAPSRYADHGVGEQEHTAGRDAEDAWIRDAMQRQGRQRRPQRADTTETPAEPAEEADDRRVADRRSADRRSSRDEPPRSGGTIDTFV